MEKFELISLEEAIDKLESMNKKLEDLEPDNPMILAYNKIDKLSLLFYDNSSIWDDHDLYLMNKSVYNLRKNIVFGSIGFGSFIYFLQSSKKIQSFNIGNFKKYAFFSIFGPIWALGCFIPAMTYGFRVKTHLKLKYVPRFENYTKPEKKDEEVNKSES
ncbi:hypothetical protein SteCoe_25641 [Stentor coeruleus]|uniref:Transmembrane protein n=1 Tax=Stentor coeruleus TaxID=5963 RepID=A0A1R2BF08_9CILI|nr:hypothetical protein SteCoe_25641 [Stentor coeruleus]